jgi:hypothetical protein
MKQTLVLAAVAAVALMGMSCSPAAGDIFPMSVGSVWHMDILAMTGTAIASLDTAETSTVVKTAVEKTNLTTGEEVVKYKYETTTHLRTPDSIYTTTSYVYCREDGDWVLAYSSLDDSTADTVMVTTPSVGKTWHQGSATTEVVGQENVTVPAGTYKGAWKVKVLASQGRFTFDIYYWYAKGTGLVKLSYEWTFLGHSKVYTEELTSATIK